MKVLIESMTKLQIHELTIRCWRQELEEPDDNANDLIRQELIRIYNNDFSDGQEMTYTEFAKKLLEIDRMNAVEIVNDEGDGVVLYKLNPDGPF